MTIYYRLPTPTQAGETFDIPPEQFAVMQANGKAADLRLWLVDPMPPFDPASQVVESSIVVGPAEARRTWAVRAKTEEELQADAAIAARAAITGRITDIAAQRAVTRATWDGYSAAQLRAEQWRDRQALLQAMDDVLKMLRRGL
jgi:hypothetical protein